jgi:hypothetical protein
VVFFEGGAIGGAGSFTGLVLAFGAGGGSGADGSWMGAVAFFATVGTTEVVPRLGAPPEAGDTGAVASRGCVTPALGRPRSVMRTVSFFRGTAAVFGVEPGEGGGVFSDSLMVQGRGGETIQGIPSHLAKSTAARQSNFACCLAFVGAMSVIRAA